MSGAFLELSFIQSAALGTMGSKQSCAVGTGTAYELSMRPSNELAYCFAELIITAHQAATLSECDGERIIRVFVARGPPFADCTYDILLSWVDGSFADKLPLGERRLPRASGEVSPR